ncbi:hypothetical protein [Streptomyces sp. 8N706]|uniref:hypothetical protein n=1 Tax=Streptomyces sp. 8N706 TaxID=3457416 RepID=UPI003FD5166B
MPESVDKAGRMMIIEGNRRVWMQVPYAEPEDFREHSLELRAERGYSTKDLYGTPPARSPQRLPSLLQVSRPLLTKPESPENGAVESTSPGQDAHTEEGDSPREGEGETVSC